MAFPTFEQIHSWADEHLISVIEACERLNWDISTGESQSEVENYAENLISEKEFRGLQIARIKTEKTRQYEKSKNQH